MKPLPTAVLKGYCFVGVSTVFTGPKYLVAELDLTWKEDLFPQGILSAIILVGGGAGDRGARTRSKCEVGPPAQRRLPPSSLGCGVRAQVEGAQVLRVRSELTLFSLCVWFLMSSHQHLCSGGKLCRGQSGPWRPLSWWGGAGCGGSTTGSDHCAVASNGGPAPLSVLRPSRPVSPPSLPASALPGTTLRGQVGLTLYHVGFCHGVGCGVWLPSEVRTAPAGPPEWAPQWPTPWRQTSL